MALTTFLALLALARTRRSIATANTAVIKDNFLRSLGLRKFAERAAIWLVRGVVVFSITTSATLTISTANSASVHSAGTIVNARTIDAGFITATTSSATVSHRTFSVASIRLFLAEGDLVAPADTASVWLGISHRNPGAILASGVIPAALAAFVFLEKAVGLSVAPNT
jgi:hypothetical protein